MSIPAGILSVSTSTDGVLAETDRPDGWVLRGVGTQDSVRPGRRRCRPARPDRAGPDRGRRRPTATKLIEGESLGGDPLDDLDVDGIRVPARTSRAISFDIAQQLSMRLALGRLLLCSGAASRCSP